jgi:hypothetical protein
LSWTTKAIFDNVQTIAVRRIYKLCDEWTLAFPFNNWLQNLTKRSFKRINRFKPKQPDNIAER